MITLEGRELDIEIFKALGWHTVINPAYEKSTFVEAQSLPYVDLYNPQGKCIEKWIRSDGIKLALERRAPHYSIDANEALNLPLPAGAWLELHTNSLTPSARVCTLNDDLSKVEWHIADTPALAICRAWLQWKNAQSRGAM